MQLIPAIDLKDGQCVRLKQGRMEDNTVFSSDPLATARRWLEEGAKRLHIVDLDGAFAGEPRNAAIVGEICRELPELQVQVGGGIRNRQIAKAYYDVGVQWLIVGTQAVREPEFVAQLCAEWPDRVIVGLDARDGKVAVNGWAEASTAEAITLARSFQGVGVSAIVYTDISRDGMMQGFNRETTAALARAIDIPVIASGGVSSYDDIAHLCEIESQGVSGAILGRAIYDGEISLSQALSQVAQAAGTA
jgi:phosphoribosylformimino-5-aminoimidazole carboxamide ribotide isomerase